MARADRIMSAFVPVITTVVTTAMSTVITVAHTRRGARSIVAAASRPTGPNIRAVAAVALTISAVSAKPSAISALNKAKTAAETPTGAKASIGETLYTCRAAIADAAPLVSTVAASAIGIA